MTSVGRTGEGLPDAPVGPPDPLRAVLDAVPAPVLGLSPAGIVDYVNEQAVTLFGRAADELIGTSAEVLLAQPRPRGPLESSLPQLLALANRPARLERDFALRRADGVEFPAEITLIPLDTADGSRLIVTVRDLTTRRQHESRMLELSRAYLSLVETNQAIVRAVDESTLFAETCRIAVEQGGYLGAWVAQPDAAGVVRRVAVAGDIEEFLQRLEVSLDDSLPEGRSPTAHALREGTAVFSTEYYRGRGAGPREQLARSYGVQASASLPLRCAGRTVAVLSLYAARVDRFDDQMRSLLEAMSENVSLALDGFRNAAELRRLALERQDLSRRLVQAQEVERARIAADVHDDSVQALAAADLRLGLLHRRLQERAPELAPDVELVQGTVAHVTGGLRDLLFDLEAADADTPLVDLVREAAGHVLEDSGISWTLELADTWDGTSRLVQTDRSQALRIIKEALFNARRHSGAAWVHLVVVPGEHGVEFEVRDDGSGFDAGAAPTQRGHRGLANMRDRAAVSGGWCRIEALSPGTSVRFWLPYEA